MASKNEIETIKKLANQGKSVNTIKNKLELPKSTVYYHFRKEVGQKQKEKQISIPQDQDFKGELCGLFAGDGGFQKDKNGSYRIRFYLNYNYRYWTLLANYLEKRLSKQPNIYKNPRSSKTILNYCSKKLYKFLRSNLWWEKDKTSSICLKPEKDFSRNFKTGFLRGFIDTDGYRRPDHKRYVFTSASDDLIKNTSNILTSLGIQNTSFNEEDERGYMTKHKIRITGEDVDKFNSKIKPRNPKRRY
ncbi:MAG: hypothetical protein ACI9LV_000283 [Candidatus Nanohaloarchaea archaeon]|jgi:hypothetical protein